MFRRLAQVVGAIHEVTSETASLVRGSHIACKEDHVHSRKSVGNRKVRRWGKALRHEASSHNT